MSDLCRNSDNTVDGPSTLIQRELMQEELVQLKRIWNSFLMIKVGIGICATIYLLIAIPLRVSNENSNSERNKKPTENVRQASDIMRMWSSGVSSKTIPNFRPDTALALATETIQSKADESIKQTARDIQSTLNARPHYIRFANAIDQFAPEFDHLLEIVDKLPLPGNWRKLRQQQAIKPNCLVVTANRHRSDRVNPNEKELYFDAEMVDAIGESLASNPKDLNSLIVLYFSSIKIGEYRYPTSFDRNGLLKAPAYSHACDCLVIDLATESIVNVRRFDAEDPENLSIVIDGQRKAAENGHTILRRKVREWIQSLSAPVQ